MFEIGELLHINEQAREKKKKYPSHRTKHGVVQISARPHKCVVCVCVRVYTQQRPREGSLLSKGMLFQLSVQ